MDFEGAIDLDAPPPSKRQRIDANNNNNAMTTTTANITNRTATASNNNFQDETDSEDEDVDFSQASQELQNNFEHHTNVGPSPPLLPNNTISDDTVASTTTTTTTTTTNNNNNDKDTTATALSSSSSSSSLQVQRSESIEEILEETKRNSPDNNADISMQGMYSSHNERWKGEWFDIKNPSLRSKFSYKSTNWVLDKLPCQVCKSVDAENAFFCDMCDEAYHHKCIGWDPAAQTEPDKWYCKEFGKNCQKVINTWGLMPTSRIYKGKFHVMGEQPVKESFVLKFKYLLNETTPKDDEPCIKAKVFGYGANTFGKFIIKGELEVYNNFKAPNLASFLQFHHSSGTERYFFKLCVIKSYISDDKVGAIEKQWEKIAFDFADISALIKTEPPTPSVTITGENNPKVLRKILKLEQRITEQQTNMTNLKKQIADKNQELKVRERRHQDEVARLQKSLQLANNRNQATKFSSNGSSSSASSTSSTLSLSQSSKPNLQHIWKPARKNTLIVTDVDCYFHVNPKLHIENNNRIVFLWTSLTEKFGLRLSWKSNVNRVNLQTLLLAHDMKYLKLLFDVTKKLKHNSFTDILQAQSVNDSDNVNSSSNSSMQEGLASEKDTFVGGNCIGNTVTAAMKSAGAVCDAIDAVMSGKYHNSFCIIRPPGHHAGRCGLPSGDLCGTGKLSQGFCILNNVAIGAFHGMVKYPSLKVAIVDIDLHAGNGTQEIFETFLRDHAEYGENILFSSIHQQDIFPYLPDNREVFHGVDPTRFINVALNGKVDSEKWRNSFNVLILPKLKTFSPDLVLISAGFDGHKDDTTMAHNFELEDKDYLWIAGLISKNVCRNVVSVLEGGYLEKSLTSSVCAHVEGLMG